MGINLKSYIDKIDSCNDLDQLNDLNDDFHNFWMSCSNIRKNLSYDNYKAVYSQCEVYRYKSSVKFLELAK